MEEVNITENDKKNLKWISKLVSVLSKIARICLYVGIVCLILTMTIIPTFIYHTNVNNNEIKFKYKDSSLVMKVKDNKTFFYSDDKKVTTEKGTEAFDLITKYYNKYSKKQLIGYSEAFLLVTVAYIFLLTIILKYVEKLFNNINKGDTPFTKDNVFLFKNIIKFKVASMLVLLLGMISFNFVNDSINPFDHTSLNVVELLIIIVCYYIFKYGYKLQESSKETLY